MSDQEIRARLKTLRDEVAKRPNAEASLYELDVVLGIEPTEQNLPGAAGYREQIMAEPGFLGADLLGLPTEQGKVDELAEIIRAKGEEIRPIWEASIRPEQHEHQWTWSLKTEGVQYCTAEDCAAKRVTGDGDYWFERTPENLAMLAEEEALLAAREDETDG